MLGRRRRRRANIKATLGQRLVFAGKNKYSLGRDIYRNVGLMLGQRRRRWPTLNQHWDEASTQCWFKVADGGPALNQH